MSDNCFHCNDVCTSKIVYNDKLFCCNGCKMVYQIINENGLDNYYSIEDKPGIKPAEKNAKFNFLKNEELAGSLLEFQSEQTNNISLFLPQIHCSSCIWLLENLPKLHKGVTYAQVNFVSRNAYVSYNPKDISLYELSVLLDSIGYPPVFEKKKKAEKTINKSLLIKLGVTGFCFGNIMLLSFPEYLGLKDDVSEPVKQFMQVLIFVLSIPIITYTALDYLKSGLKSIRAGAFNIDVPISIGILTLYIKSTYDILALNNASYMDSFAGFIFFLLIGKWFQSKTYSSLSFERDYKSYFPIGVTKLKEGKEEIIGLDEIEIEDEISIKNEEIIPADALLLNDFAQIDYSFVTGESTPVSINKNDKIFAGGKLIGTAINIKVLSSVKQSYLTHLWNQDTFKKQESKYAQISNVLSKRFTIGVIVIAIISAVSWLFIDTTKIIDIVVSVLIVACPCALALAVPFTFGTVMRFYGKRKFYIKNIFVIERLSRITDIVFDKTGTITQTDKDSIEFTGDQLTSIELDCIGSLVKQSSHVLSKSIYHSITINNTLNVSSYKEEIGKGISGLIDGKHTLKIGSSDYLNIESTKEETAVHVSINNEYKGKFIFSNTYKVGIASLIHNLKKDAALHVLSGDNESERENLEELFAQKEQLNFNQQPLDKLTYIKNLQEQGKSVMMVGDGLNDAGALKQSDVGIVVTENTFNFTPSSDGIIEANSLIDLDKIIRSSKKSIVILAICYAFSICYNVVGLCFAVSGNLTPLIAAILMPLSSIFIVVLSTLLVSRSFQKHYPKKDKSSSNKN